ncbi:MAG: spermidine synthase [Bilifractor sp.]
MAVELGANRLLAPYFSSSQIVWTIIIGTIMIAMALGNVYGGRAADKNPDPDRLYKRILIAAVWIAAIPVFGKYVILGISALMIVTVSTNLLIWAALFSCLVIFVFPLFLLGTVTPSLIKFTVDSLETSGSIAGKLSAANTIGSIIGTFLPTFVTIPTVGTAVTFLIFAGVLLLLCLLYFLSGKMPHPAKSVSIALVFILCCVFGHSARFAFWENDLTYEGESVYNYLQVKETDKSVSLSTNVLFGVQSVYEKTDQLTGMYYDYAMAAPLMCGAKSSSVSGSVSGQSPVSSGDASDSSSSSDAENGRNESLRILILGNGTGTYATQCERYFDNTEIEGVEIDGKIIKLATEFFEEPSDVKVTEYDGRAYLNAIGGTYDVIMVDAYRDITIPFQMSSVEFFTEVRSHLSDGGVMVVNMNMRGEDNDENSGSSVPDINTYLADTISSVFPQVYTVDVPESTNRELFASNRPADSETLPQSLQNSLSTVSQKDLRELMQTVSENLRPYSGGNYIMTDDRAPVEMLGIRQIDSIIQEELPYYKEQIRSGNFSL